jgi:hypothetical protein
MDSLSRSKTKKKWASRRNGCSSQGIYYKQNTKIVARKTTWKITIEKYNGMKPTFWAKYFL